jgi:hypothetical protein
MSRSKFSMTLSWAILPTYNVHKFHSVAHAIIVIQCDYKLWHEPSQAQPYISSTNTLSSLYGICLAKVIRVACRHWTYSRRSKSRKSTRNNPYVIIHDAWNSVSLNLWMVSSIVNDWRHGNFPLYAISVRLLRCVLSEEINDRHGLPAVPRRKGRRLTAISDMSSPLGFSHMRSTLKLGFVHVSVDMLKTRVVFVHVRVIPAKAIISPKYIPFWHNRAAWKQNSVSLSTSRLIRTVVVRRDHMRRYHYAAWIKRWPVRSHRQDCSSITRSWVQSKGTNYYICNWSSTIDIFYACLCFYQSVHVSHIVDAQMQTT